MGTEIFSIFNWKLRKMSSKFLSQIYKDKISGCIKLVINFYKTSNSVFSPSNWSKCKISVPITLEIS